jgi:hypothetical protein
VPCNSTNTATVYELVFIIRGSKLCVAKKLALPELTKMIGVKVQEVIWVRIT